MITESAWKNYIMGLKLKNDFNNLETNKEGSIKKLSNILINTIKSFPDRNLGIALSGGIDSSLITLIAKNLGKDFICYSVGLENSSDIMYAKSVAEYLNVKLRFKILSLNELENIIKNVFEIINSVDVTKVSVGSVLYSILDMAHTDNIEFLATGLGSEEIFAGYERHLRALNCNNTNNNWQVLHEECWNGLLNMFERDLCRDYKISEKFRVRIVAPFLEQDVIVSAMNLHPIYKINETQKKIILREIAEYLGMPSKFAWRGKSAAQYGSRFLKGIDKLAKHNGFEYKKDYLKELANKNPEENLGHGICV